MKKKTNSRKAKIVVVVEGGNISEILADRSVEVVLLDYDVEQSDKAVFIPQGDDKATLGFITRTSVTRDLKAVKKFFGLADDPNLVTVEQRATAVNTIGLDSDDDASLPLIKKAIALARKAKNTDELLAKYKRQKTMHSGDLYYLASALFASVKE
jgi:hypothetical protein